MKRKKILGAKGESRKLLFTVPWTGSTKDRDCLFKIHQNKMYSHCIRSGNLCAVSQTYVCYEQAFLNSNDLSSFCGLINLSACSCCIPGSVQLAGVIFHKICDIHVTHVTSSSLSNSSAEPADSVMALNCIPVKITLILKCLYIYIASWAIWLWSMVSYIKGEMQAKGIWKQDP